jgi:hypothetical protein
MRQFFISLMIACWFAGNSQFAGSLNTYYQQRLAINPSFAADQGKVFGTGSYVFERHQGYTTSNLVYGEAGLCIKKSAVGVNFQDYTEPGNWNFIQVGITYARRFGMKSAVQFIPSIQLAFIRNSFLGKVYPYPPGIIIGPGNYDQSPTKNNLNLSMGLLLKISKIITVGAAFYNISQPDIGIAGASALQLRHCYSATFDLLQEKLFKLKPYATLIYDPHFQQFEAGCFFQFKLIQVQLAARENVLLIGPGIKFKFIQAGYSINFPFDNRYDQYCHQFYLSFLAKGR